MRTKVAKYPECPYQELVRGFIDHTYAGGIILFYCFKMTKSLIMNSSKMENGLRFHSTLKKNCNFCVS
jgi:hypothetical protein